MKASDLALSEPLREPMVRASLAETRLRLLADYRRTAGVETCLERGLGALMALEELPANPFPLLARCARLSEGAAMLAASPDVQVVPNAVEPAFPAEHEERDTSVTGYIFRTSLQPTAFGLGPVLRWADLRVLATLRQELASTGLLGAHASTEAGLRVQAVSAICGPAVVQGMRHDGGLPPWEVIVREAYAAAGTGARLDKAIASFAVRAMHEAVRLSRCTDHVALFLAALAPGPAQDTGPPAPGSTAKAQRMEPDDVATVAGTLAGAFCAAPGDLGALRHEFVTAARRAVRAGLPLQLHALIRVPAFLSENSGPSPYIYVRCVKVYDFHFLEEGPDAGGGSLLDRGAGSSVVWTFGAPVGAILSGCFTHEKYVLFCAGLAADAAGGIEVAIARFRERLRWQAARSLAVSEVLPGAECHVLAAVLSAATTPVPATEMAPAADGAPADGTTAQALGEIARLIASAGAVVERAASHVDLIRATLEAYLGHTGATAETGDATGAPKAPGLGRRAFLATALRDQLAMVYRALGPLSRGQTLGEVASLWGALMDSLERLLKEAEGQGGSESSRPQTAADLGLDAGDLGMALSEMHVLSRALACVMLGASVPHCTGMIASVSESLGLNVENAPAAEDKAAASAAALASLALPRSAQNAVLRTDAVADGLTRYSIPRPRAEEGALLRYALGARLDEALTELLVRLYSAPALPTAPLAVATKFLLHKALDTTASDEVILRTVSLPVDTTTAIASDWPVFRQGRWPEEPGPPRPPPEPLFGLHPAALKMADSAALADVWKALAASPVLNPKGLALDVFHGLAGPTACASNLSCRRGSLPPSINAVEIVVVDGGSYDHACQTLADYALARVHASAEHDAAAGGSGARPEPCQVLLLMDIGGGDVWFPARALSDEAGIRARLVAACLAALTIVALAAVPARPRARSPSSGPTGSAQYVLVASRLVLAHNVRRGATSMTSPARVSGLQPESCMDTLWPSAGAAAIHAGCLRALGLSSSASEGGGPRHVTVRHHLKEASALLARGDVFAGAQAGLAGAPALQGEEAQGQLLAACVRLSVGVVGDLASASEACAALEEILKAAKEDHIVHRALDRATLGRTCDVCRGEVDRALGADACCVLEPVHHRIRAHLWPLALTPSTLEGEGAVALGTANHFLDCVLQVTALHAAPQAQAVVARLVADVQGPRPTVALDE